MPLLLDTHIVLWWFEDSSELPKKAEALIKEHEVFVSAVTLWEISIKRGEGKLKAPNNFLAMMQRHSFRHLPVTLDHALAIETLPKIHQDPFDRMLVAQAQAEQLVLLTHDKRLAAYGPFVMVV